MLLRTACTAAWTRLSTWSFIRMLEMWFRRVLGVTKSPSPTSWFDLPSATSLSTPSSRSDRGTGAWANSSRSRSRILPSSMEAIRGEIRDFPVGRLVDDLDAGAREHLGEPLPVSRMIVRDNDSEFFGREPHATTIGPGGPASDRDPEGD